MSIITGVLAEWLCVLALCLKGYRIIGRRLPGQKRSGAGEIDILAMRGNELVIIEVKARQNYEKAAYSIKTAQRKRLVRAARSVLARHPELSHCSLRFDAMLVMPYRWPLHLVDAWREQV